MTAALLPWTKDALKFFWGVRALFLKLTDNNKSGAWTTLNIYNGLLLIKQ